MIFIFAINHFLQIGKTASEKGEKRFGNFSPLLWFRVIKKLNQSNAEPLHLTRKRVKNKEVRKNKINGA